MTTTNTKGVRPPARELVDVKVPRSPAVGAERERARAVCATLPHQQGFEAASEAEAQFGLLMSGQEIHDRIVALMPRWGEWSKPALAVGAALVLSAALFFSFMPGLIREKGVRRAAWEQAVAQGGKESEAALAARGALCNLKEGLAVGTVASITALIGGVVAPLRTRKRRDTRWEQVKLYRGQIPDAALLRYDEAQASGKFEMFFVVEAVYQRRPATDPWLVGVVKGRGDVGRHERNKIVLAYWE